MTDTAPYPSLQGNRSFDDIADTVRLLDEMVVRLKFTHNALRAAAVVVEKLPVKRRGHLSREYLLADLRHQADKTLDTLIVHGFYERRPE